MLVRVDLVPIDQTNILNTPVRIGANGSAADGASAKKSKTKGAKPEANGSHAPIAKPVLPPLPTVEDVGDIEVSELGQPLPAGGARRGKG